MCIYWEDIGDHQSPAPKQLNKPTTVDVPLPKAEMVMYRACDIRRVSQCERHFFVNTKQWKQLEIFMWSVESMHNVLVTTRLLMCRVKDV